MNRSRLPLVILMIASLVGTGLTREWASAQRNRGPGAAPEASAGTGISRLNSYALALLLGGLRGPLVMILWPSAEEQKTEKDLEDFDTKIELIRLLQAEFDTVHLFQIWNKAYNVSAQLASYSNKYRTILDAIDYAQSVKAEKPDDINIIHAIGSLYFDKLGSAYEKEYYRARVREETMFPRPAVRISLPAARQAELTELIAGEGESVAMLRFSEPNAKDSIAITIPKDLADHIKPKFTGDGVTYEDRQNTRSLRQDANVRRTSLDPMLDEKGMILPNLLAPTHPRPADLNPRTEWNDGSELQYLAKYQPFPDGISTLALGYNYFKQAQVLNTERKQKHAQISDETIGSRPGFSLKTWAEEDWMLGRRAELEAFGKTIPDDRLAMEVPTADLTFSTTAARPRRLDDVIRFYAHAIPVADDALREYERHLANNRSIFSQYAVQMAELRSERELIAGDLAFIQAYADAANRPAHVEEATKRYRAAITAYQMIILEYFVSEPHAKAIFPEGTTKANIAEKHFTPEQISDFITKLDALLPANLATYDNGDAIDEYFRYINRATTRLATLK